MRNKHSELAAQALLLGRQGFRIVPCARPLFYEGGECFGCSCRRGKRCPPKDRGKHAAIRGWLEAATSNEDQIALWWSESPRANIGIVPTGFQVLDLDSPDAGEGWDLPPTYTVKTRRGEHRYYALPPGEQLGNPKLCHGIDTRGHRGLVLAPGSLHPSGVRYELVQNGYQTRIEDLPAGILERLRATRDAKRQRSTTGGTGELEPAPLLDQIKVRPEIRRLILEGAEDRSQALAQIYRALEAARLTRGQIASICWDEDHRISDKPREKGLAWFLRDIDRVLDLEQKGLTLAQLLNIDARKL
jgi:Bifunctional DNA primase/polymerase, N-terminal